MTMTAGEGRDQPKNREVKKKGFVLLKTMGSGLSE